MTDYFGAMGTALYTKLTGGTALITALGGTAIYASQAPDNTSQPYIIFSHQGGGPEPICPREMRNNLWSVRAYGTTPAQANALDGLCDALLHKQALSVSGWTNFWSFRETDISLVENLPNGEKIYMAGAFYRVRIAQ